MRNSITGLCLKSIKKAEVENQLNRKIKVVGSARGGEYYSRYDRSVYVQNLLSIFLKSVVL